jgi:ketosteroid isomerase-like protein
VRWEEAPIPDLFPHARSGGRAELTAAAEFVCSVIASCRYTLVDAFAGGDRVAAQLVYDADRRDGVPVRLLMAALYRWRDGRVVEIAEYPCRAVVESG